MVRISLSKGTVASILGRCAAIVLFAMPLVSQERPSAATPVTIKEARALLNATAKAYGEEDVQAILSMMDATAEGFDYYKLRLERLFKIANYFEVEYDDTIGRLSAFMGNAGVLLRAYIYARLLGKEGMKRVAEFSTLNAAYLASQLRAAGFELAYPKRRASHEFIITLKREAKELGVTAMDFAKNLLDRGYHAPTTYFPLLIPECLLIEPTESESKEELDGFVSAMVAIREAAESDPDRVRGAPYSTPVRRLDEVRAARNLDLAWRPGGQTDDK